MATKTPEQKSVLGTWLWRKPLKFAIGTLFASFVTSMLWGLGTYNMHGGVVPITMTPLFVILTIITVLGIGWLIWRLPRNELDRASFIALRTGTSVISFIISIVSIFIMADIMQSMFMQTAATGKFSSGTVIALIVILVAAMYIFGLYICAIYGAFLRMRKMGVPTWKLICALPFGYAMLWPAGFVIDDARAVKSPVIAPHATWYKKIITRITSNPYYTMLTATGLMLMGALMMGLFSFATVIAISGFIVFGFWFAISGATNMRRAIPGIFASIAVIFNIVAIIISLAATSPEQNTVIPTQTDMEITVTETIHAQQ